MMNLIINDLRHLKEYVAFFECFTSLRTSQNGGFVRFSSYCGGSFSQVYRHRFIFWYLLCFLLFHIICLYLYLCCFSVPAPRCNVAPSAAADAAQTGRGDAERSLPLSQHQTGLQSGLRILTAGSRLQQVCHVYSF